MSGNIHAHERETLAGSLNKSAGIAASRCYQCGKCTAGCPLAEDMDVTPSHILRHLQLDLKGLDQKILSSYSIWMCLACETCFTRCPQEVDIPKMMDFLRSESISRDLVHPKARDLLKFHKAFLDSIKKTGRLYEIGLIAGYKMRTFHFFQDLFLAPKLYFLGKLNLLPHVIKDRRGVSRIFKKAFALNRGAVK